MKKVRIGIIGLGYWGPNLLRNFSITPGVTVVGCADLDRKRLQLVRHAYPAFIYTRNYHELFDVIDAVIIATPPKQHFSIALEALGVGKHVLIEKPMTTKFNNAMQLTRLAQKNKLTLMVDHIFVYSSPIQKIKDLITTGELGKLYYFDSMRVNLGLFQSDTNVLWDLASHDLSILNYLISTSPESLACVGKSHTKNGHEDIAYLTLSYRDNLIGHINVNWLAPNKTRRIIIGGSKKMVVYDESEVDEKIKIYDKSIKISSSGERHKILFNYRVGNMIAPFIQSEVALKAVCRQFVRCIQTNTRPLTDGFAGANVVKMLEVAEQALRSGRTIKFI